MSSTAPLILASSSARRSELLNNAGFPHRVVPPTVDDAQLNRGRVSPIEWVQALAHLKLKSVIEALAGQPRSIIIAADTLVVRGEQIFGQPTDHHDAERTIRALTGRTHHVITSVALDAADGLDWITDTATVTLGDLTEPQLARYIASDQWHGKAGAYNLSERLEDGWPIQYQGDPATVMGLPMKRLTPILEHAMFRGRTNQDQ